MEYSFDIDPGTLDVSPSKWGGGQCFTYILRFYCSFNVKAWAKVENVSKIPTLEWLADWRGGAYTSIINSYLPVIALLGLILLLPLIFDRIAILYEQRKTLSGVENSIVGRYFWYQLANIYITVTGKHDIIPISN